MKKVTFELQISQRIASDQTHPTKFDMPNYPDLHDIEFKILN